jgi:predicted homoserine dehydrogenase-like protein
LERPVAAGAVVTFADVRLDANDETLAVRREMERAFRPAGGAAADETPCQGAAAP